jgi:hypothetical protein
MSGWIEIGNEKLQAGSHNMIRTSIWSIAQEPEPEQGCCRSQ